MKSQLTTGIRTRGVAGVWSTVRSLGLRTRIAFRDRIDARNEIALRNAGPSVKERQAELVDFYETYEQFVEVLCDAAQYGPTPRLESSYDQLHRTMVTGYSVLRPFVGAFLPPEDLEAFRLEAGRPQDAFESLIGASNLRDFLLHDDGEMIFRIMRTREALNLYGEHLRQLASRVA